MSDSRKTVRAHPVRRLAGRHTHRLRAMAKEDQYQHGECLLIPEKNTRKLLTDNLVALITRGRKEDT